MAAEPNGYEIREGYESMDFAAVQRMLETAYWCPGITLDEVERAARNSSLLLGAFHEGIQIGYLRVVSDKATFGWISDVFVEEGHRGKRLAQTMTQRALNHPEHQGFRRWVLKTRDAHAVYAVCGFRSLSDPDDWMIYVPKGRSIP
jgi:GNAT superfamily N-acetyltransferase